MFIMFHKLTTITKIELYFIEASYLFFASAFGDLIYFNKTFIRILFAAFILSVIRSFHTVVT